MIRTQNGVALITALLVVAIAAVVSASMMSRQQIDIRRTANMLQADQAWLYVQGMESWAEQLLMRDYKHGETDHLGEDWARPMPPIPVDGGSLNGSIEDMQGRFNLNNLVDANGDIDSTSMSQFVRLLEILSLNPDIADALLDWLDHDVEPRIPGGAEDDVYLTQNPSYRASNRKLVSVTELRLLRGMDAVSYSILYPHVTVLPETTTINVNTANVTVLRSLANSLTDEDAMQIIYERGENGYSSAAAFLQNPIMNGREVLRDRVGVKSSYFLLYARVQVGRIFAGYQIVLQRDHAGHVRSIKRDRY